MRSDALNSQVCPVRTEMTTTKQIQILHIFYMNDRKLKEFLVHGNISKVCSMDEDESKVIIINKCSTEEDES